jgi:hypothetical protein
MTTKDKTNMEKRARAMLSRAFQKFKSYDRGTYGERDTIEKDLPNAIEAMIDAKIEARMHDEP